MSMLLIVTGLGAAADDVAAASIDSIDSSPGWEAQLSLGVGVVTQAQRGKSSIPTQTSRTTVIGDGDAYISPQFKIGLDLLTPFQADVVLRPRLVLRGSFQTPLSSSLVASRVDRSFNRGAPGFDANCPPTVGPPPRNATNTCSLTVRNNTTVDYLWTAGVGVQFTLPFDQQQYHFTQGFEYIGMAAQAEGRYFRRSTNSSLGTDDEFLDASGDLELFHGISLTETFSVDAYQSGPIVAGFYLEGRVSWFATERDMHVTEGTSRGPVQFASSFNDPEPFQYQAVAGVTFRLALPRP